MGRLMNNNTRGELGHQYMFSRSKFKLLGKPPHRRTRLVNTQSPWLWEMVFHTIIIIGVLRACVVDYYYLLRVGKPKRRRQGKAGQDRIRSTRHLNNWGHLNNCQLSTVSDLVALHDGGNQRTVATVPE